MKLLFDQNVSPWLCRALADVFPDSVHVREVGLPEADDNVILGEMMNLLQRNAVGILNRRRGEV